MMTEWDSVSICTASNANMPISGCPQIIVHTQSNVEQDNYSKNSHAFLYHLYKQN